MALDFGRHLKVWPQLQPQDLVINSMIFHYKNMDDDEGEVEFEMQTSDDAKTVTLIIKSNRAMSCSDLITALEFYLTEMLRAEEQRSRPGTLHH